MSLTSLFQPMINQRALCSSTLGNSQFGFWRTSLEQICIGFKPLSISPLHVNTLPNRHMVAKFKHKAHPQRQLLLVCSLNHDISTSAPKNSKKVQWQWTCESCKTISFSCKKSNETANQLTPWTLAAKHKPCCKPLGDVETNTVGNPNLIFRTKAKQNVFGKKTCHLGRFLFFPTDCQYFGVIRTRGTRRSQRVSDVFTELLTETLWPCLLNELNYNKFIMLASAKLIREWVWTFREGKNCNTERNQWKKFSPKKILIENGIMIKSKNQD